MYNFKYIFINILSCIILYKLINLCMYNDNHCNIIATTLSLSLCLRLLVIAIAIAMHFLLVLLIYTRSMDINRRMKLYSIYKTLHRLLLKHICGEGKIS